MFLDWMEPFWSFDRVTSNKKPYTIKKDNEKCVIVHEALGISPEDIEVKVEKERGITYLVLKGATKNKVTGDTYRFNSAFQIDEDQVKSINKIAKDGLLYVVIEYKEAEQPKIEIGNIEDANKLLLDTKFEK